MTTAGKRNAVLGRGINVVGRAKMYKKRQQWKYAKKGGEKKAEAERSVQMDGRYVEADDKPVPLASNRRKQNPQKLKKTIKPGSVLIVLSGRFRGKHVVFLKQLESGLLLVTGPYKCNGCPIRRINQAYCIGTSTVVDLTGVTAHEAITDATFARVEEPVEGEEGFFKTQEAINPAWLTKRKELQKQVDTQILASIAKVPLLKEYLASPFTLTKGMAPHMLKF